jgi:hypothetical protein
MNARQRLRSVPDDHPHKPPAVYRRLKSAVVAALLATLPAPALAAGGAYAVDDVEIGKPGDCKVESWVSFASNHDLNAVTSPACVVNLGVPVELGALLQRARSNEVWTSIGGVKGKLNLIPLDNNRFGLGLSGGTSWNLNGGENTGSFVNVPVTFHLLDAFRINVNVGWQYDAIAKLHYGSWGAGFEWDLMKPVTLIGEVYGLVGPRSDPRTVTEPRTQLGLRLTPVSNVDLDLIWGRNIAGENAHWITIGLNLRY